MLINLVYLIQTLLPEWFPPLLDRPLTLGETEDIQIDTYFSEVERIRKFVRNAETESLPTIESASTQPKA